MKLTTLAIVVTAAAAGAATPLQAQDRDWSWSGRVTPGKTLTVRGVNGSIEAERASGSEIQVTAHLTEGRRGDPRDVRIEVQEDGHGTTLCVVYPGERRGRPNACDRDGGEQSLRENDTRVDFTVRLPANVQFEGYTVNGDVRATSLGSNAHAATVNGDVSVTAAGLVEASTVNGSIRATMGRGDWTGSLDFSTVNGSITVELPSGVGAEVSAQTVNGAIDSDFPITVTHFNTHRLTGRIGDAAGRSLKLTTVNGGITLRRGS